MRKPISKTINGIEYRGEYEVKVNGSAHDLFVYYDGKHKVVRLDNPELDEAYASQLLFELITGRYIGSS